MQNVDYVATLMEMKGGKVVAAVSKKFNELMAAVCEVKSGGTISLTLKITPSGLNERGDVNAVDIEETCAIKKPERTFGKSMFYVTPDAKLTTKHPDQQEMEFEPAEERR